VRTSYSRDAGGQGRERRGLTELNLSFGHEYSPMSWLRWQTLAKLTEPCFPPSSRQYRQDEDRTAHGTGETATGGTGVVPGLMVDL